MHTRHYQATTRTNVDADNMKNLKQTAQPSAQPLGISRRKDVIGVGGKKKFGPPKRRNNLAAPQQDGPIGPTKASEQLLAKSAKFRGLRKLVGSKSGASPLSIHPKNRLLKSMKPSAGSDISLRGSSPKGGIMTELQKIIQRIFPRQGT